MFPGAFFLVHAAAQGLFVGALQALEAIEEETKRRAQVQKRRYAGPMVRWKSRRLGDEEVVSAALLAGWFGAPCSLACVLASVPLLVQLLLLLLLLPKQPDSLPICHFMPCFPDHHRSAQHGHAR
jgi:hypothetical protein